MAIFNTASSVNGGMPVIDYSNLLFETEPHSSNKSYTAVRDCCLFTRLDKGTITIDGIDIGNYLRGTGESLTRFYLSAGDEVSLSDPEYTFVYPVTRGMVYLDYKNPVFNIPYRSGNINFDPQTATVDCYVYGTINYDSYTADGYKCLTINGNNIIRYFNKNDALDNYGVIFEFKLSKGDVLSRKDGLNVSMIAFPFK